MGRQTGAVRRAGLLQCASFIGLIAAGQLLSAPAHAQEEQITEVVVTGSRTIRDGSTAPTPVTVVGVSELQATNPRNIVEGLISLPAFRGSQSTNTPALSTASNNTGSFLNLRGLGAQRTLVLLDGRRVAPAANNGATNFNLLPQALIDRVDVVTGGASAAYGSDAVAGVVNVILDKNFRGLKGSFQYGLSSHKDVGSQKVSLTAGDVLRDGKLHLLGSLFYNKTDSVLNALGSRDWASDGDGRLIVGTGAAQFSQIFSNVNQNNYNGGVILAGTTNGPANLVGPAGLYPTGVKFLPGGVSSVYDRGTNVTANNAVGGDGSRNSTSLAAGLKQTSVFGRATYDLSQKTEVYGQLMAARASNVYEPSTNQNVTATAFTIFEGNPYIPADIAAALAASPGTTTAGTACGRAAGTPTVATRCFKLSRINQEDIGGGITRIHNRAKNEAIDLVVGFKTEIFGDYALSGYYEFGDNDYRTATDKNANQERLFAAVDAVRNPANGQIVCRVTLTNPGLYPGCVPLNPFGFNSPSLESLNYANQTSTFRTQIYQHVAALNLAGSLFELPAGPLGIAVGAEYRIFDVDQTADPGNTQIKLGTGIRGFPSSLVGLPGIYNFGNASVFSGKVKTKELYGEINVPLLKDLPLVYRLEVNGAARYTDYSTSGGVVTYKVGTSYSPVEWARLRATYSRDIRAPSPIELFQGNGQGSQTVVDPFNGNQTFNILGSVRGNTALNPEKADTYTVGLVLRPPALPGFTASIDYYNIKVNDSIGNLTTQSTLDQCFQGNQDLCKNVVRDGAGIISTILQPYLNFQQLKTAGIDVEVSYRTAIKSIPGTFTFRGLVGYLETFSTQAPGSAIVDTEGQVGSGISNPRFRGEGTLGWEDGPVGLTVRANFTGAGLQNKQLAEAPNGVNTIVDNHVPSVTTFDLSGRYRFGDKDAFEAFLTINNLFNKDPPVAPGTNSANFIQTNYELYDTIGRYYTAGLRFRF